MALKKDKVEHLIYDTYLYAIKSSIGADMFRHYFIRAGSKKIDALRNGDLACAFYVTSLLRIFGLIDRTRTTVIGCEASMLKAGWFHVKRPKIGSVIVWRSKTFKASGEAHKHIGFYIGHKMAISNNSKRGMPYIHKYDFRPIESIYWHRSFPS